MLLTNLLDLNGELELKQITIDEFEEIKSDFIKSQEKYEKQITEIQNELKNNKLEYEELLKSKGLQEETHNQGIKC
jgi:hypothetical protein